MQKRDKHLAAVLEYTTEPEHKADVAPVVAADIVWWSTSNLASTNSHAARMHELEAVALGLRTGAVPAQVLRYELCRCSTSGTSS
jgi:hypothetical protein